MVGNEYVCDFVATLLYYKNSDLSSEELILTETSCYEEMLEKISEH